MDPLLIPKAKTLVQQIITNFREDLIAGKLLPGQRLPSESKLSSQLGASRTSVREAMKHLAALGVVEIRRGEGTYVAIGLTSEKLNPLEFALILDPGDSRELLELRRLIDLGCCELVALHATEEDFLFLNTLAIEYKKIVESNGNAVKVAAKDIEFHKAFLCATHNRLLEKIGNTVLALFTKSIIRAVSDLEVARKGTEHHLNMVEAIRHRDVDQIKEIVESHLSVWYKRFSD
jgi:GntR family transcriptional repressor for pyruvate dehydrogenase complex